MPIERVPYLQVRNYSMIAYSLPLERNFNAWRGLKTSEELAELDKKRDENLQSDKYTGKLSPGAKKRLTKAIEIFCQVVESEKAKQCISPSSGRPFSFKFNFITLTLAETERMLTGKEGHKQLLEPFLLWLRRKHGVKLYIWKAELQQRGQLHYHITTNVFIPYKEIRRKWNELQRDAGLLEGFKAKFGHYNPPSTEIRKVQKDKLTARYLQKEIGKGVQNTESLGGKVWDCSMNIKKTNYFTADDLTGEYHANLTELVKSGEARPVYTDHCIIYEFKKPANTYLLTPDYKNYKQHLQGLYNFEEQPRTKLQQKKIAEQEIREVVYTSFVRKLQILPIPDLFSPS